MVRARNAKRLSAADNSIVGQVCHVATAFIGPPRQTSPRLAVPFTLFAAGTVIVLVANAADTGIVLMLLFAALAVGTLVLGLAFVMDLRAKTSDRSPGDKIKFDNVEGLTSRWLPPNAPQLDNELDQSDREAASPQRRVG